jgi:hypothetical protein
MDFVDNQATNIYRIGCELLRSASPPPLVSDGGFEFVSMAAPTLTFGGDGGGGGSHGGWRPAVGNLTDDRVRLRACAAAPHAGRYAGRLQLPTAGAVALPVPLSAAAPPGTFRVTFFARCSPPGVLAAVGPGGGAGTRLGANWTAVEGAWTQAPDGHNLVERDRKGSGAGPVLNFTSPFETGAAVWIDSVSMLARQ